ncbi:MAG: glycosyltransferase family 4 protein [Desulfobacter sp.]|nr:MAG: glycosyltransferase family 4 protein [Desulfobacter sp.]
MRIGLDARVLTLPEMRGIANYILEILKFWPNMDDQFFFFYESGHIKGNLNINVKYKTICVPEPPGTRFKVWQWLAMPHVLDQLNVDVLWCPANIPIFTRKCKQVLTVHDTLLQESFRTHNLIDSVYFRKIIPFWVRHYVNRVITVSSFSKDRIYELFKIPKRKIRVIHNGLPTISPIYKNKKEAQENLWQTGIISNKYLYALGAESPWKNTENLILSFASIVRMGVDIDLVLTGIQNSILSKLQILVAQLNIEHRVKLVSYVDNVTRDALYQGAELFIYPSLFEGFGFPPLEAMKLGCPVIASDKASIPEVVGTGAILADCTDPNDLTDKVLFFLNNQNQKYKLIEKGNRNSNRFDWKKSATAHRLELLKVIT